MIFQSVKEKERSRNSGPVDRVLRYIDNSTVSLLHFNGPDGSTDLPDDLGLDWTLGGGTVEVDTAQSVFGGASAKFQGSASHLVGPATPEFIFGTANFAIDFWFRIPAVPSANLHLYDARPGATNGLYPTIFYRLSSNTIVYYVNATVQLASTTVIAINTWYHVAVTRFSGTTRLFINGVAEGGTWADATNYLSADPGPRIGPWSGNPGDCWLDEYRISASARWNANFTPPTEEY